ncbi:hypothetical protein E6W39_26345 [Kitasatospora acidiphila]|uniref:Lipoprotein n=1 Tax=Kitasatospora acidiphila TaxID=2567942 RepID=A0A540W7Y4_9ACTN|nr:hypothetical protein [Kitasatospora acidiphila]TQF05113.1 hypothetical protein E6W39_26345 [Kitasatospora acidiphila]
MSEVRVARGRRLALAVGGAVAVALLAGGCGIRPTAIPVDAGAPASRGSCPSPLRPPAVAPSPPAGTLRGLARGLPDLASASPSPSVPGGSVFSAAPSPSPTPSGTLHC